MQEKKKEQRTKLIAKAREQANVCRESSMGKGGQRFADIKKVPGVGDYAIRNNWTKKSYNVKYNINVE
jgi:hypothetical protein